MRRNVWRSITYRVFCQGCDFNPPEGSNGLGLAAQHHDRTGHSVNVESFGFVHYLNAADHAARQKEKAG